MTVRTFKRLLGINANGVIPMSEGCSACALIHTSVFIVNRADFKLVGYFGGFHQ